jgi:SAM-dependent methyltransferase
LLWNPLGRELVAMAEPASGERVLDACCGAGASALSAAEAVGPSGIVDAVDLAGELLASGRAEAGAAGYDWLRFVKADLHGRHAPPYDLVQFGYGAYFMPDLDAAGAQLAGLPRPGGRLAVMVWDRSAMGVVRLCVDAVRPEKPDVGPSDRRARWTRPTGCAGGYGSSGSAASGCIGCGTPCTGLRGPLRGLSDPQLEAVKERYLDALNVNQAWELDATSLVGLGWRG